MNLKEKLVRSLKKCIFQDTVKIYCKECDEEMLVNMETLGIKSRYDKKLACPKCGKRAYPVAKHTDIY